MNLLTPIEKLSRIGPQYQKKLKKMGIKTIEDLFFHFPHRYEDFSNIQPISKIKLNETCCILGKILEIKNSRTWKRKMTITQAIVKDDNIILEKKQKFLQAATIRVVWFNQSYLIKSLKIGDRVCLAGKINLDKNELYLSNPIYEKISNFKSRSLNFVHTGRLIPVYPETEKLSSRWLRYILKPLLIAFKNKIPDPLPEEIRKKYQFLAINQAIWQIHFPISLNLAEKARQRFAFEELFLIQLLILKEKIKISQKKAYSFSLDIELIKDFVNSLPFKLTNAQKKSAWQILKDLEKNKPMNRLLEGDVGSGKTIVAIIAALLVVKNKKQVTFMAPTEILAKQHFQTVSKLLNPFKVKIALLTGKEDKIISQKLAYSTSSGLIPEVLEISRKKLLDKTKNEEIDILIGTHALIQDKVKFNKLALVILDEQHRFGIKQRAHLCQASGKQVKLIPHLLSMTATPIPRTLALTIYGDLDLSLIDELPKGRKKIITEVVSPAERKKIYQFIKKKVRQGRQVFVVCPRIESALSQENLGGQANQKKDILSWAEVKAVKEEYEKLSKEIFPNLKIAMLHGKIKTKEKEKIMKNFKNKKIDILVSTSVIEVGIDVPNAAIMLIEGAERFGLAQLHQFRGRIGRSKYKSFCFLFTESRTKKTKQRLNALIKSENGFELAEKDLQFRGPGSFVGVRQWGIPDLAMSCLKNLKLIEITRETARQILEREPELKKYPLLKKRVEKFQKIIHFE